jgi:L-asparaginase II
MTGLEQPALTVLVRRGGRVESCHRVRYALANADGQVLAKGGNADALIFPRSASKPLQAIPLVESGAADRFELGDAELALASASHSGELRHTDRVAAWLQRIGCTARDLLCGVHLPYDDAAARALVDAGERPSALHNNCSGKHAGMLTLARHLEAPLAGYLDPGHPVQRRIADVLLDLGSLDGLPAPGIDGCGVPTWPMPLTALAVAAARLGTPAALSEPRRNACERIVAAMAAHPLLVAGAGQPCSRIMAAVQHVLVKTGAEGVYLAALLDRGLGLALKVEDGSGRAAPAALLALLRALAVEIPVELDDIARPAITNRAGVTVGEIEAALPESALADAMDA